MNEPKMTDEEYEAYGKLSTLQKEFVRAKMQGMNDTDAYKATSGKATTEGSIRKQANQMVTNGNIAHFLNLIDQRDVQSAVMSREEMLERLSAMARTSVADVVDIIRPDDQLMDMATGKVITGQTMWSLKAVEDMTNGGLSAISELTAGKEGFKFKLQDQRAAMKQLAELLGYDAPQKVEVAVTKSLDDFYNDQ